METIQQTKIKEKEDTPICECGHKKESHTDSQPDMIGFDNLGKCIVVIGKKPIEPVKLWNGKFQRFNKVRCSCKKFVPEIKEVLNYG